jgi:hypothetical protein
MCSLQGSEYSNLKLAEGTMERELGSSEEAEMNQCGLQYTWAQKQH